jgi:hypothetical protein
MATPVKVYTEAEKQANRDAEQAQINKMLQTDAFKNAMGNSPLPSVSTSSGGSYTPTYTQVKDKTGQNATVNNDVLYQYLANGYTTDLNKPLNYNDLPANSIYRTENQGQVGSQGAPMVSLTNTPSGYEPLKNMIANPQLQQQTNSPNLQQAMQTVNRNGTTSTVSPSGSTNNSGLINSQYDNIGAQLKALIQQSINNKNTEIGGLGAKYQPQRNQSEVAKNNDLRTALEMSVNNGDRGGVGRQQSLDTQTAGANRLNQIGLQQTSDETNIKNDIANLLLNGDIQQAQNQASRLRDLLAQSNSDKSLDYQRSRDAINDQRYADETAYNQSQDAQTRSDNQTEHQKQDFITTIGQYSGDYTQAINDIANDNNTSNDWQIPYLKTARAEKVAAQNAAKATALVKLQADQNASTKLAYEQAFDRWRTSGVVSSSTDAKILGVNVGAKTEQYAQDQISNSIAQQRATTSAANSSSSGSVKDLNSSYADAVSQYNNMLPGAAMKNLKEHAGEITDQIGSTNYNKLVTSTQNRLYQTMLSEYNGFTATAAFTSLTNSQNRIIDEIGVANYNKLYNSLKSRYDAVLKKTPY